MFDKNKILSYGKKLFIIRKLLGVTQEKFAGDIFTRAYISSIETDKTEVTPGLGLKLINRAKSIAESKKIKIDIDLEEFMESEETQRNRIEDKRIKKALNKIELNPCEKSSKMLDDALICISNEKAIKTILRALSILKRDIYANADLFLKYSLKIMRYSIEKSTYIKVNLDLIPTYNVIGNYQAAIIRASEIKEFVEDMEKDNQIEYFWNTANSYYYLNEYNIALRMLHIVQGLVDHSKEQDKMILFLSLESNIFMMKKNFIDAIEVNEMIIERAKQVGLNDYIANSKSNIAYMKAERGDFDTAKVYLDEALSMKIDIKFRINVLYNLLDLQIKTDARGKVEDTFMEIIELSLKTKNTNKINDSIKDIVEYYIKNNREFDSFIGLFLFLKEKNVSINQSAKIEMIKYFRKDDKFLMQILAL